MEEFNSSEERDDYYEEDEDDSGGTEEVLLDNTILHLPSALFRNPAIFSNFFSMDTLHSLDPQIRDRINALLPNFPDDDVAQKLRTLEMLFNGQNMAFGNPLLHFRDQVLKGRYDPDCVLMSKYVRNGKRRDKDSIVQEYQFKLMHDLLVSRKSVLEATSGSTVSVPLAVQKLDKQFITLGNSVKQRSKRRYLEEIEVLKTEVGEGDISSDDEWLVEECEVHGSRLNLSDELTRVSGFAQVKDETKPVLTHAQYKQKVKSLKQETHASYFDLLCDLFECSPNKRSSLSDLEKAVSSWQDSPIAGLNSWYCLTVGHLDWVRLLESAVMFLAGQFSEQMPQHFAPYVLIEGNGREYKWQGEGREAQLAQLFQFWWHRRDTFAGDRGSSQYYSDSRVKPSSLQERLEFQRQEAKRYSDPSRGYRWVMQDYSVCVGPVKSAGVKLKSHPLLKPNRPSYVTVLSVVRDAVSRLPNGEGSRLDILELLKDSQFLVPDPDLSALSSTLSSALDRLQSEHEPCVAFDGSKKLWIYCHRDKSIEDLEILAERNAKRPKKQKNK